MSNLRKLSKLEEETVLQYTLDQDSRGFPCQISIVEDMANRLLADRNAPPVGKRWAINLLTGNQSSNRVINGGMTIREPYVKTRLSFAIGSGL
jgi:hypothetical protein